MEDDGEEDWEFNPDPDDGEESDGGSSLSLDALSASFAQLIGQSQIATDLPTGGTVVVASDTSGEMSADQSSGRHSLVVRSASEPEPDEFPATPLNVLEAILFVGHPSNEPVTGPQIASLIRGVEASEVDGLVRQLNANYDRGGCPYEVVSVGAGYRLLLRQEYVALRDKFYGKVREARLTQAAIDILSIVAYQQPVTRKVVESICQKPAGAILNQLVRRQLVRVDRSEENPRDPFYATTDRFLMLFGLGSLDELPRSENLDREL